MTILPYKNESFEGMIRGNTEVFNALHCGWTSLLFVGKEPFFNVLALVCNTSRDDDWLFHEISGNGASEILRKLYL